MADTKGLEEKLDEIFMKKAPFQLPEDAKKWIVQYLPYINLVLGIFALWGAYNLYRWATVVNKWADYANEFARSFGVDEYSSSSRLTFWVWLSIGILAAQGLIYVISFSSVKAKKKSGWNLLFYALIAYTVYGFISLFVDSYGSIGNLFGYIIGTAVGLYFLFQIRSYYLPTKSKPATKPATEKK